MGKTLRADIVIGGKADNSFYQLGSALETLGSQVNLISEKLIQFGRESVDAYASYEDYMLDAEVALRTQYNSASELGRVMDQLDRSAMQWASDSRFTTEDVAGAISNAAHAGWDLEKMLSGVPSAMKISLAGGMELAEGLEYLVDISNAAGIGFEDLGMLVDYWAYAANRSSTTIPEMGQAMQKMGATMQFVGGDMAGLTTMLGVLANNGAKGTEAGTLLRNSFIRLIAPTKKAAEAMDDLVLSGEDIDEIYSNTEGLEQATQMLEAAGFSAYDSEGRLRSFMTIWQELDKATSGMTEQDRNNVLSAIFPTRTITGALALLEAASNDWDGLYRSILDNGSGYADYAAHKLESGLGGAMRHLESVYNTLQTKTGKALADDVTGVANALSGMIDSINGMDDAAFGAIVSGLEVIAAAGPAMLATGGAIKLIGMIAGTGLPGLLVLAGTGLTAAAVGFEKFNEATYEAQFGKLSADLGAVENYLNVVGADFDAAAGKIGAYNAGVEAALGTYQSLITGMKSDMVTDYITGTSLTKEQIASYYSVGTQIVDAVKSGIEGNYNASEEIIGYLAGTDPREIAGSGDEIASEIMGLLSSGYERAIEEAEGLGKRLREAMTSAFADGKLSAEEMENINGIYSQLNELMEQQENAALRAKYDVALDKALALGKDGADQVAEMANDWYINAEQEAYSWKEQAYAALYRSNGGAELTTEQRNWIDQRFSDKMAQARSSANGIIMSYWDRMMSESDLSGQLADAESLAGAMLNGYITPDAAHAMFKERFGSNTYAGEFDSVFNGETAGTQMGRLFAEYIAALGGQQAVAEQIDYLQRTGQADAAKSLQTLYAMEQIANNYAQTGVASGTLFGLGDGEVFSSARDSDLSVSQANKEAFLNAMESYGAAEQGKGLLYAKDVIAQNDDVNNFFSEIGRFAGGNWDGWKDVVWGVEKSTTQNVSAIIGALKSEFDFGAILKDGASEFIGTAVEEEYAAWRILFDETFNAEDYRIQVTPEVDTEPLDVLGDTQVVVDIIPRQDGMGLSDLEDQGVTVDVSGDTTTLSATINAEDGQHLLEYVDGDAANLTMSIMDQDGKTLVENVTGDASALGAAISAYDGKVVTVKINYTSSGFSGVGGQFAEGGRATEASIFGEAGPEWAIPEQHTQRTADLLNAARAASGFTWPELIESSTGQGGSSKATGSWTLVYSPVIHAANAAGVEDKLRDDKNRLEKWLREKQLHDELEVYQ